MFNPASRWLPSFFEFNKWIDSFWYDFRICQNTIERIHLLMWVICLNCILIYLVTQFLLASNNMCNVSNYQQYQFFLCILAFDESYFELKIQWILIHVQIFDLLLNLINSISLCTIFEGIIRSLLSIGWGRERATYWPRFTLLWWFCSICWLAALSLIVIILSLVLMEFFECIP